MLINLRDMQLPPGFNVDPSDEDAIFFLNEKVFGGRTAGPMILELDPYDPEQLPDILSATDKLGSLYFFTKLRRKSTISDSSTNIDRTVRGKTKVAGCWHGETKKKDIEDERKKVIGISRKLSYRPSPRTAADSGRNHNRYIMTEFLLDSKDTNYDIFRDGVLCRLAIKNSRRKDGDEVGDQSAARHSSANSSCEGVVSTPIGAPSYQALDFFEEDVDVCSRLPADPTEFPAAAARTCEGDQALAATTVLEVAPLQTVGVGHDIEHSGDQNQVATEVEAKPAVPINNLQVQSTAVGIAPHDQSIVNYEDGDEDFSRALMTINYEEWAGIHQSMFQLISFSQFPRTSMN